MEKILYLFRYKIDPKGSTIPSFRRLTGSVYLNRENSPLRNDKRLLAIPPSCSQVADYNPNLGNF